VGKEKVSLHPSDRFLWEYDDTNLFVTDGDTTSRFTRLQLPGHFRIQHTDCACGRNLQASIV
jgi:hypothetical protein